MPDDKAKMMKIFKDLDARVLSILEMVEPSSTRLWQLLGMDPTPITQRDRLCLLGDAALLFLPHIGQGAAWALGDAASIAVPLPPGTNGEDITERLQVYEDFPEGRVEELHSISRLLRRDLESGNEDARINRDLMAVKYSPYIFNHDGHDQKTQKSREYMWKKSSPRWSMPTSFGAMPEPRQTFTASKPTSQHSTIPQ